MIESDLMSNFFTNFFAVMTSDHLTLSATRMEATACRTLEVEF
jgi:hypothetical protein